MLRADSSKRRNIAGLNGSTVLSVTAILAGWLVLTACDQEAAPAPQQDVSAAASDLFGAPSGAVQKAPPPLPPPPSNTGSNAGSKGPGAAAAPPPLVPVLDPAVAAECKSLRDQEMAMRKQADQIREKRVAPAGDAFEKAYNAFNDCQTDFACANNEGRYSALGSKAQKAEKAMEKEETALMEVEGQLHDVSQKISVKCGDF